MANSKDLFAKLKQQIKDKEKQSGGVGQNNYYPFWEMKVGQQAVVRFLPDNNPDNPLMFLSEKLMHTLNVNGETKSVPCLKMYGEDCPICKISSDYYKQDDKDNGKKYYRKKQYLGAVLVVEDPLPPDADSGETHEGKIRWIALGKKLYDVIKDAFESGDLDDVPFDYQNGTDFIIKKTQTGEFADYSRSKFAKNPRDLSEEEIAHAEASLINLSTLLPKKPEREKIENMLEAALTGNVYQEGGATSDGDDDVPFETAKPSPAKVTKPVATTKAKPEPKPEPVASAEDAADDDAQRILEEIRRRKKAQQGS